MSTIFLVGHRSSWANAPGKIPVAINTRLEKITNRYWSGLLKRGRAIPGQ